MIWKLIYNTVSAHGHRNLSFDPFSFAGRLRKRSSMFAWILISVVAYVFCNTPRLYKSNCTINIGLVVWDMHGCYATAAKCLMV